MTTISLVATDQLLSVALQPKVASGDKNSVELHVDFDSEWDGYGKSAVFFTDNDKTVYEVVMTDGNCMIPHEVLAKAGTLYIGVRGVNNDNAVKTSSLVKYKIVEGAPTGNGTTVEPTADVYQQLLVAYSQANARVNALVASHNSEGAEEYSLDIYGDGTAYITIISNGTTAVCTVSNPVIFGMGATRRYSIPERFAPPIAHYEYDGDVELCIADSYDGYTEVVLKNKNQNEAKADGVWFQFVYALAAVYTPKELLDIRVGADGTIYKTAGEAVRSQFQKVNEKLNSLNDARYAGKLLYVDTNGNVAPLSLGAGLAIVDGVLTIDPGVVDVGALLSSDGYALKDSNGLYVKAKEVM